MYRMIKASTGIFCLLAVLVATPAVAQSGPTIRLVSPSTAGGGSDILARLLADQISRKQGRTVVVENRPGAGNVIGTEYVARSAPDGSTILITTPEFVINPHLKKVNYDPIAGFEFDLLFGPFATADCSQQRTALPHVRGASQGCSASARSIDHCERRASV